MKITLTTILLTCLATVSARLQEPDVLVVKPANGCQCQSDYDCHPTCVFSPYSKQGFCRTVVSPTPAPPSPAPPTPGGEPCPCKKPKKIPTECEVKLLIQDMDLIVSGDHKRAAQWLRASFHDAGTFDQTANPPVGGANGCLMNHPPMLLEAENAFLDLPVLALKAIRDNWEAHPKTCIDISSADIIQFAGFFATVRQRGVNPGVLDATKISKLLTFKWGRSDETFCNPNWTHSLPGFTTSASGGPIPGRCTGAGGEIKSKMMDKNGFTAEEATALIGAHTIGLIRNTFGVGLAGPWVTNGDDSATADGPVFDNAYHDFLINTIVANNAFAFAANTAPFNILFPDWFRDSPNDLDHLDTDIALAFPSLNTGVHPHFHIFSANFASSNSHFLKVFDAAYVKMSNLGVSDILSGPTKCDPCNDGPIILDVDHVIRLVRAVGSATAEGEALLDKKQEKLTVERERHITIVKKEDLQHEVIKGPKEVKQGGNKEVQLVASEKGIP